MRGRRVMGADGREWRVRRRWLPWQPRKRGKFTDAIESIPDVGFGFDLDDGFWGIVAAILAAIAFIMFVIFVLPIIVTALEILLVLVLLPLFVFARVVLRRPWIVIARTTGPPPEQRSVAVSGWRASREAMDELVRELQLGRSSGDPNP